MICLLPITNQVLNSSRDTRRKHLKALQEQEKTLTSSYKKNNVSPVAQLSLRGQTVRCKQYLVDYKQVIKGKDKISFSGAPASFDGAVLWARHCTMPSIHKVALVTHGRTHSFAEEFVKAQFVLKNRSAKLAKTDKVPTTLSHIKAKWNRLAKL